VDNPVDKLWITLWIIVWITYPQLARIAERDGVNGKVSTRTKVAPRGSYSVLRCCTFIQYRLGGLARSHAGALRVNPDRVNEHRVNEHRVNPYRVNEHRVNPHRVNPTWLAGDPTLPVHPKEGGCLGLSYTTRFCTLNYIFLDTALQYPHPPLI